MSSIELHAHSVKRAHLGIHRFTPGALEPGSGFVDIEIETRHGERFELVLFVDGVDIDAVGADLIAAGKALIADRDRDAIEQPIRERMEHEEREAVAKLNGETR